MGTIANALDRERRFVDKALDEISGKPEVFRDMRSIVTDLAHEKNPNDPDIDKKLERYFKLVETSSYDTCFICNGLFDCKDNPRVCLSYNLEIYVCPHCAKTEKEFLTFVETIIW